MSENPNTWSPEQRIAAGLPATGPLIHRVYYTFLSHQKSLPYIQAEQEHWQTIKVRREAVDVLFDLQTAHQKLMEAESQPSHEEASGCFKHTYKDQITSAKIFYMNACIAEERAYKKKMSLAPPPPERITVEEWVSPCVGHPFTCVSCKNTYHYELNYKGDGYKCKSCC